MLIARCNRRADRARQVPLPCDRIEELKLMIRLTIGVALEEPEACWNVKRRRLAYICERPLDTEAKQEESK
jgi:hypothetical protein